MEDAASRSGVHVLIGIIKFLETKRALGKVCPWTFGEFFELRRTPKAVISKFDLQPVNKRGRLDPSVVSRQSLRRAKSLDGCAVDGLIERRSRREQWSSLDDHPATWYDVLVEPSDIRDRVDERGVDNFATFLIEPSAADSQRVAGSCS